MQLHSSLRAVQRRGYQMRSRSRISSSNIDAILMLLWRIYRTERNGLISMLLCLLTHRTCTDITSNSNLHHAISNSASNNITGIINRRTTLDRHLRLLYNVGNVERRLARRSLVITVRRLFCCKRSILYNGPGVSFRACIVIECLLCS